MTMFVASLLGMTLLVTGLTFLHEYAHYLVAVRNRIEVIKVSIGVGPTLWKRVDSNGTRWEINLLPFMGGTYLAGATAALARIRPPRHGWRALAYAPPAVRIRVFAAGIAMNLLIAWAAYTGTVLLTSVPRAHTWWAWFAAPYYGLQSVGRSIRFVLDHTWQWVTGISAPPRAPGAYNFESFGSLQTHFALMLFAVGAVSLALAVINLLPLWPLDGFLVVLACYDWVRAWIAEGQYELPRRPIPRPLSPAQQRWLAVPSGLFALAVVTIPIVRALLAMLP